MFRDIITMAACGAILLSGGSALAQPAPWTNAALSPDARADLVQARMTTAEELLLLKGYYGANVKMSWIKPAPVSLRPLLPGSAGFVPGIERLGVPSLRETDAGVGIANTNWMRQGDTATAFPSGLSNAASWDPALIFAGGAALGAEARDRGFNVVLDGGINLAREPHGGRSFEYAGEDPLLAGTIVGAQIRGIQSQHVISTIKHFALNDQETGRVVVSADIDESAARESDLLAFEIAIEQGDPGAVMCAYNRVNSDYACENDFLLNRVLKRDWGYLGWVLSDWGGVHSTVAAANAGLDQESASGFDRQEFFGAPLQKALADGSVGAARLHDMVHRILRTMFANGLMDFPMPRRKAAAHVDVAERSAAGGIVLLRNEQNVLPLAGEVRTIAVIGAHADLGMLSGGGSSQVLPLGDDPDREVYVGGPVLVLPNGAKIMPLGREIFDPPAPLAAIARLAPQAQVRFADGDDIAGAAALAAGSDIVIVFAQQWMTEGADVPNLSLPGNQDALIAAIAAANPHTVVVLETGGPVLMPWRDKVPAILEAWYGGSGGAMAVAQILFGAVNPSGRLPVTFPRSEDQLPRPVLSDAATASQPFDVAYSEGADVGYRWFELRKLTPLFPFGFGLSYTTFDYRGFETKGGDTITASVSVTNTGARAGSETVQLYATPPTAGAAARLVGWSKVRLEPGETRLVTIAAEPRLLAHFDGAAQAWHIAAGDYVVSLRRSATDIAVGGQATLAERTIKP
ncbi:MAG: glycoside hydrolase family 3 C-terminal domain-containing protein [Rhizomicrobium sp.]